MLILSRKRGEAIRIGDEIVVTVIQLGRGRVQLGIEAPTRVPVNREEVYRRTRGMTYENREIENPFPTEEDRVVSW
ncbi:MAG TPA: carbon storage regulator [Pirellulales bacterium]|nr:carbon storage regulator [Pirellulales bacterium]